MNILFDVGVPRQLAKVLNPPHQVTLANQIGLARLQNGELLKAAEALFDVLVSLDSNVPSQHDMSKYKIGFIVLRAWKNTLPELLEMSGRLKDAVAEISDGRAIGVFYDEALFKKDLEKNKILDDVFIYD